MKAVLTFHSIDYENSILSFRPDTFEFLLNRLVEREIPILPLELLLKPETEQGVTLSFDDGVTSVFDAALPLLRRYNAPAHVFLSSKPVGGTNRWPGQPQKAPLFNMLNWDQVKELNDSGIIFDAHTHTHRDLRQLSDQEIGDEFDRNDEAISNAVGRSPKYLAYPYGFYDERVSAIAGARYSACFTTSLDFLRQNSPASAMPRLDTFYLRPRLFADDLFSSKTRGYIFIRALLRGMRSAVS